MADNVIYIAAGFIPNDTGEAENSNEIFVAAGLIPDDIAAPGGVAPTSTIYGPLFGPFAGPI